jgi:hypothetical protein
MELWSLLKYQRGPNEVRLVLLSKTLSVLRHHYQRIGAKKDAMNTMREFCRVFGEFAAELVVKDA